MRFRLHLTTFIEFLALSKRKKASLTINTRTFFCKKKKKGLVYVSKFIFGIAINLTDLH